MICIINSSRYINQNVNKYASMCDSFIQSEYMTLIGPRMSSKRTSSTSGDERSSYSRTQKLLMCLSEIEFEQLILWSDDFERTYCRQENFDATSPAATNPNDLWSRLFDARLKHSNEILTILSSKIQSS